MTIPEGLNIPYRGGLVLQTENFDEIRYHLKRPPIIVNDLDRRFPEDAELLDRYLVTNYDTATFSMVPMCDCGLVKGGYNRGKICPECHSEVLSHTEQPIDSNLWLRTPEGVAPFISPIAYNLLSRAFEVAKIDVIRWLCDVHYKGDFSTCDVIVKLIDRGVKRGYNNFIENFWDIINILLEKRFYTSVSDSRKEIYGWLLQNKDNLFTEFLPLPNRLSLVTEKTPTGKYGELVKFGGALEAAMTMASLKTRIDEPSQMVKESTVYKCVLLLSQYYFSQYRDGMGKKEGTIRKHICGTRMPFTARNVISSLHEPHEYDELHVPWAMAIGLFRIHLTNKMLKDGYTPNEILEILHSSVNKWNPLIRRYFDEMLAECPHKGIPCCFNRNPTLLRGSIQQFFITKIKDDVNINTISISVLVLGAFNADPISLMA